MFASYHAYAPFYDGSGQIRFAVLMGHYLQEVLVRHPAPGKRALDLACGTGTLALLLAETGWAVLGLDAAPAMLAQARARTGTAANPQFIAGDLRGPLPNGPFDLVTCTYDSLNYLLTEADLARCFAAVARVLTPGGLFFFDLNTRHFLEHDWRSCELDERLGFVQLQQSTFDPTTGCSTMRLTGFVGDDQDGYERFDEIHIERAYDEACVRALIAEAGLRVAAVYDCFTFQPPYPRSQRLAWVVQRA